MKILRLEPTPNPNALKFVVESVISNRPYSFKRGNAQGNPLAERLFQVQGIKEIFYLKDFITVVKDASSDWEEVMLNAGRTIQELSLSELEALKEEAERDFAPEENALLKQIQELLDREVKPFLANDGGGLEIIALDGKRLFIRYIGACGTCPHSTMQTLFAIQNLIWQRIDSEIEVIPS